MNEYAFLMFLSKIKTVGAKVTKVVAVILH